MVALQLFRGFWRYAGVFVPTVFIAISQTGGFHPLSAGLVVVVLVLAAFQSALYLGFGLMGEKGDEQNRKRKQMIDELAEANRRLEETLAEKAGLQAQLLTQAREAGVSAERQRMAREIHDTLAQGLAGIITQLEAAQQAAAARRRAATVPDRETVPGRAGRRRAAGADGIGSQGSAGSPGEWRRHVDTAARLARHSLAEARRSVNALRPQVLDDAKLPDALSEEAARWSAISEVKTGGGHHRQRPAAAPGDRGHAAAHRAGGAGQRGQARRCLPGRAYPVLHGGRGDPGRAGRRPRLRPGHRGPAAATADSAWRACGSACATCPERWRSNRSPAAAPRSRPACRRSRSRPRTAEARHG